MLKQLTLLTLLCFIVLQVTAQQKSTDSLWNLAISTKSDTIKFNLLNEIGNLTFSSLEGMLENAKREVAYGEKYKDKPSEVFGYFLYARLYNRIGNYIKSQEAIVKATIIAETMPYNNNYLALIYNTKGSSETNENKAIEYLKKGIAICKDDLIKRILLYNTANKYLRINQIDSALSYTQKSNEIAIKIHDTASIWMPLAFGNINLKLNQPDIAYAYFRKARQLAEKFKFSAWLSRSYGGMIDYFSSINNNDSVLFYKKKYFDFDTQDAYPNKVAASEFIYKYYLQKGNKDSAIKYLLFNKVGNDSLNSFKKIEELKQAKITEELRQKEVEFTQQEEKESRNHNIQLAVTAIIILSAIILFLLLSRTILVSHKLVEFLSVLVLLVVFEFINLLIHPFLENITHHSPFLMLMALVAIASLIIPLHHRLEHWTTQKLVEKNKAIRLANAKKTIEEIESSNK